MKPKPKEYILCAAVHFDNGIWYQHQPTNIVNGFVVCGRRHNDCFTTMFILMPSREYLNYDYFQGFITNTYRFVNREDAMEIALEAGQVKQGKTQKANSLHSEDLY